ncbi:unnamed protein product [Peniophora sp. CBMAI 1063]|nr:unnamed protein product [Peniophora sp. CBMAI 1063]
MGHLIPHLLALGPSGTRHASTPHVDPPLSTAPTPAVSATPPSRRPRPAFISKIANLTRKYLRRPRHESCQLNGSTSGVDSEVPIYATPETSVASTGTQVGLVHPAAASQHPSRLRVYGASTELPSPSAVQTLAFTYVQKLEHGEETGSGVAFQLVGSLAEPRDAIVYAAIARPFGGGLSNFPAQVVLKMRSKARIVEEDSKPEQPRSSSYAQALSELRSMRKLAVANAAFCNQALATFQDRDWLYIVSRWYTCNLSEYIRHLNKKNNKSGKLYHLEYKTSSCKSFALYAAELLLAMEELQKQGIVHLDVKPDNVFVTPTGHVVLGDFDLSYPSIANGAEMGRTYRDTPLNHACGTTAYMAPEVLEWVSSPTGRSDVACPTQRADMWSLGMTLLEFALMLNDPYFELLAPELFTSTDVLSQARSLHEYISYVWSMSGEDRGEGGERMARQLKKQLNIQIYNFLCGLLEMDPAKRLTIEEAQSDFMLHFIVSDLKRGEYDEKLHPLMKPNGAPESTLIFADLSCATAHLQETESSARIGIHEMPPFHTYGPDWISPNILEGIKPSGPEHGQVNYGQTHETRDEGKGPLLLLGDRRHQ